jgi:predicted DNA-binding transcriptional regulator AlpA
VSQKLLKASEIRKLLNLNSDARVYELARQGILPGVVRIGRQVRFDRDKIFGFIASGGRCWSGGWRREGPQPAAGDESNG